MTGSRSTRHIAWLSCSAALAAVACGADHRRAPAGVAAHGSAPATSPGADGLIAFRRYADVARTSGAVFTVRPDGGGIRQITHPPADTIDEQPDWSPDGTRLVFCRGPVNSACALTLVYADGTGLRQLTPRGDPPAHPDDYGASFTPDGKHVTFTRASGHIRHLAKFDADIIEHSAVAIVGTDGRGEHEILRLPRYSADVAWPLMSPDGKRLLFERLNSPAGHPGGGLAVFVAHADGSKVHRVTPWHLNAGDGSDWAPDGARILVRSHVEDGKQSQYYTVRPDGSRLTRLTHFAAGTTLFSAGYSPDGRRIAFGRGDARGRGDLWVMDADGTHAKPVLRQSPWDSAPDWGSGH